jgi:hypothetical protein
MFKMPQGGEVRRYCPVLALKVIQQRGSCIAVFVEGALGIPDKIEASLSYPILQNQREFIVQNEAANWVFSMDRYIRRVRSEKFRYFRGNKLILDRRRDRVEAKLDNELSQASSKKR